MSKNKNMIPFQTIDISLRTILNRASKNSKFKFLFLMFSFFFLLGWLSLANDERDFIGGPADIAVCNCVAW